MKKLSAFLISAVLCTVLSVSALASGGNVTYVGASEDFIFSPGSEYSPVSDLFDENFKGVMPGDEVTEEIVIKNAKSDMKAIVYMRALGSVEGELNTKEKTSKDFLSQMTLTIKQGNSTLFEAPANETAQLTDWVCLGTLSPGGEAKLSVTLNVPIEMDDKFQEGIGYLNWEFKVDERPTDAPPTGDANSGIPYIAIICACAAVVIIAVIVVKKRKSER